MHGWQSGPEKLADTERVHFLRKNLLDRLRSASFWAPIRHALTTTTKCTVGSLHCRTNEMAGEVGGHAANKVTQSELLLGQRPVDGSRTLVHQERIDSREGFAAEEAAVGGER